MMYRNGFIIVIKHKGKVLRESDAQVFLPFGSEYTVTLKNKNNTRGIVRLEIDGMDISNGQEFVIPAGTNRRPGVIELERFMLDGNMLKGKRFKFVSLDHQDVVDPTDNENGVIKATFWKEVPYTPPPWNFCCGADNSVVRGFKSSPDSLFLGSSIQGSTGGKGVVTQSFSEGDISYCNQVSPSVQPEQAGATVEGSESNQSFGSVITREKDIFSTTELTLKLVGHKEPVLAQKTRTSYCPRCGYEVRSSWNFCISCGVRL